MNIELDEAALSKRQTPGPALYWTSAMPTGELKAVVGILHGYADHGARYAHVMGALSEHGIGSIAIDMRGHGRAEGARGFAARFTDFHDDVKELRALLDARAKGVPHFLFGHSFGGLVATSSALEDAAPWRGLLLSAPFFGLALQVPQVKILAGKVASRVYPKLGLPSGLEGKDMTHDEDKARQYDGDPLVFKNATARWFTESLGAQERVLRDAASLGLPVYMVFGSADRVASMSVGKRVFDAFGSSDKTWEARPDLFHEVLNEPSWKEIVENMARWILAHA